MTHIVERLAAAMNAHDLEGAAALIGPDYDSRQPAHPTRSFTGRSQMHANWGAMFAGIPDFHADLERSVVDGDTVWSEWHWTGSRTDGQPFEVRGVTLFVVRDDLIVAGRLYMEDVEQDGAGIDETVRRLAGRVPAPTTADEA
jgi:ketosteroid isomerase-like protein